MLQDQRKLYTLLKSLQWEQERAAHGMCRVEGDKHATHELNIFVIIRDFRGSLSVGNELCTMYAHSKRVSGFINFHIQTEIKQY